MSSIQEKMEALRVQKEKYSGAGAGAGSRKFHNAPKNLRNKHATLPRPTAQRNNYQSNSQISLFSNHSTSNSQSSNQLVKKDSSLMVTPQLTTPPPSYSPIQFPTNGSKGAKDINNNSSNSSSGGSSNNSKNNNPKLIPNLDPLQSCYGSKRESRTSQLMREDDSSQDGVPKGILSRPSSPVITPGKKKRVTFNFEDRPSSSSYAPPSYGPPSPGPVPVGVGARGYGTSGGGGNSNGSGGGGGGGRPMRPSLSEQLSAIADKAGDVTADIKAKAGLDKENNYGGGQKPLLSSPAKNFTVGHLQCRYAAAAEFFPDRLEYKFHHPFQNSEIHLTLYYRDMINASLTASPSPGKLIFRVPRHLVHFAADYDPSKHYVVLFLSSSADLAFIRKNIMPKIK